MRILCLIPHCHPGRPSGGQWGGLGVISAICSTNREFRKGNHTKCIYYFKIRFFISFFSCRISKYFFLREHCLILYFFIFIKIPFFFLLVINFPLQ